MSDEKAVLAYIRANGAATERQIAEGLQIERPAVRHALALLVLREKVVWVGQLPRQGVYFKEAGKRGFGFGLARSTGRPNISMGVVEKFIQESGEVAMRISEIVKGTGYTRLTVLRAIAKLEETGKVEGYLWKEGGRGRPAKLWGMPGWTTQREADDHNLKVGEGVFKVEEDGKVDPDDDWRDVVEGWPPDA